MSRENGKRGRGVPVNVMEYTDPIGHKMCPSGGRISTVYGERGIGDPYPLYDGFEDRTNEWLTGLVDRAIVESGFTNTEVAEFAGVHRDTVYKLRAKKRRAKDVMIIAKILHTLGYELVAAPFGDRI